MTPSDFCERMLAYCHWSGGSCTSWIRTVARNERVGGHPHSYHLLGLGMDVAYGSGPDTHMSARPPLADARKKAKQLGIRLVREGDHDHFQPASKP
jgi:hypothetical protein